MAEDRAISLGHPSYVWGFGQERRLHLIRNHAPLDDRSILDVGCGLGMYVKAFRRFSEDVHGVDVDPEKVAEASETLPNIEEAPAEQLPYSDGRFDVVLLHEVIEHVADDAKAISEAVRVLKGPAQAAAAAPDGAETRASSDATSKEPALEVASGGRLVIFAPNRLYPFETHGAYWRGAYHFGNIPLVNYLPDRWRNRLCPHVRTYTSRTLGSLVADQSVRVVAHTQVFPGYDKIMRRWPTTGRLLRVATYSLERTPLRMFGLSHFLVVEKTA
jgi:SAM-dependent methyltransferase